MGYTMVNMVNLHCVVCMQVCVLPGQVLMAVNCTCLLLQTTPSHILSQLDKLLREASTLDGVLEFRHEHFWTLAFGILVRVLGAEGLPCWDRRTRG